MKKFISFVFFLIIPLLSFAQLDDFCEGDKGDPIFFESFGDVSVPADPNAIGTTSYLYVNNGRPIDGSYTISSSFNWFPSWFTTVDHTPGDTEGKALIVNADNNRSGQFFERKIEGLCSGTTYEFSTWMLNITSLSLAGFCTRETGINGGIPINVRFEIWDESNTTLLNSGDTGDIFAPQEPIWEQYGLTFRTVAGQESVVLKILNNGIGGCGNDLALDDIQFVSCGDKTEINTSLATPSPAQFCNEEAGEVTLGVMIVLEVFTTRFYQWQQSSDGQIYTDILGANNDTFITENLTAEGDYYYRVKIAETLPNLLNSSCSAVSEIYLIQIRNQEAVPSVERSVTFCDGDDLIIEASPPSSNRSIRWYDLSSGGNLLFEGEKYNVGKAVSGNFNFYVEAFDSEFDCPSPRVEISVEVFDPIENLQDEIILVCPGEEIRLKASDNFKTYKWSTGAETQSINVTTPGEFTVALINRNDCEAEERFNVIQKIEPAKIKDIQSDGDKIIVTPLNEGDYEYSLDGANYQSSAEFIDRETGNYTVFIRDTESCNTFDEKVFFHLNIPKFFTPNGDGIRDEFVINEIKSISIFNRYGKLIKQSLGGIRWDGTYTGKPQASDSYWYLLETENNEVYKGFVVLKR